METKVLEKGLNFAITPEQIAADEIIIATESALQHFPLAWPSLEGSIYVI